MAAYDLLVIDPQNDFLDIPGAALPVQGANADMQRLADWLLLHLDAVHAITVTLDSHASVGVERTTFWHDAQGQAVPPFTLIRAADVESGRYAPRYAQFRDEVLRYLRALEAGGQRQLVVWPVHCVLGTWGHNVHGGLSDAIAQWEAHSGRTCHKVLKGQHPLTEQYSAFRAEVRAWLEANYPPSLNAPMGDVRACCVAKDGTLYALLRGGHALAAIKDGKVNVVVNKAGKPGPATDGPAADARMLGPKYVTMDAKGNVLILDTENHCLRVYDPAKQTIRTLVGNGKKGSAVGADWAGTQLNRPHGARIGPDGRLYVTDTENNRILIGPAP